MSVFVLFHDARLYGQNGGMSSSAFVPQNFGQRLYMYQKRPYNLVAIKNPGLACNRTGAEQHLSGLRPNAVVTNAL